MGLLFHGLIEDGQYRYEQKFNNITYVHKQYTLKFSTSKVVALIEVLPWGGIARGGFGLGREEKA